MRRSLHHVQEPVDLVFGVVGVRADPQPAAAPLELKPDPSDPSLYSVAVDMKQSQSFRLHLTDEQGRRNKQQPELALNVLPNRAPELKLEFPSRDVDVSPLEELTVKAQVWDDFGVRRVGLSYSMAGEAPTRP